MTHDIRRTGVRRFAASAIGMVLLLSPMAGAQAQPDQRDRPDAPPGYSGQSERQRDQSDQGKRRERNGDNDDRRERWNERRGAPERYDREHRRERRYDDDRPHRRPPPPRHPRPYDDPYGRDYPQPYRNWRPAPYPPAYPPPVYDDFEDMGIEDMSAPSQRRAPARIKPERAVTPPAPPRRPPVTPPVTPVRADTGIPAAGETRMAPNEVLVSVASGSDALARELARTQRLQLVSTRPVALSGVLLARYRIADRRSISAVITALERDARVLSAQPNYFYTLTAGPDVTQGNLAASQYGLARLRAGVAQLSAKGNGVLTAVIDSGIDEQHRELKGAVIRSIDFARDSADTSAAAASGAASAHAHGTAIAGIIGARDQMSGVAPAAQILALRAFAPDTGKASSRSGANGSSLAVLLALDAAVQAGARVVNMSFSGPRDPLLTRALAAASAKNIILVAAAGNDGADAPPAWPAADPNVIAVTATDAEDQRVTRANRGDHIAVAAPGADILGPTPGNAYQFSTGSSMAAAHVTGVIALLLEANPALTAADARKILMETAKDLGAPGRDADFGAGLVDAAAAVGAAKQAAPAHQPAATEGTTGAPAPTASSRPAQAPRPAPTTDARATAAPSN